MSPPSARNPTPAPEALSAAGVVALGPGARIAGYRLITPIGAGGMGQVFLAHDDALDRKVALKVLPPEDADEEARARFLRESRALARVDHRHVVRVFASGDVGGVAWMALEYIEGDPLSLLLAEGPLDEETALSLAAQAARGLAAAHREGVVHRDVKPDNLLLDDDGVLRVVDFGIALVAEPAGQGGFTTQAGIAVGTPHYMAPEQARGGAVDARADAWGLGATLFALLAGRPPFFTGDDESDLDILSRVLRDPVPDLRARVPGISKETARLVARLLEKDRDARLADLDEVAATLDALADRAMQGSEGAESDERAGVVEGGATYPLLPDDARDPAPREPTPLEPAPRDPPPAPVTAKPRAPAHALEEEGPRASAPRALQLAVLLVTGALLLGAGAVVGKLVSDRATSSRAASEPSRSVENTPAIAEGPKPTAEEAARALPPKAATVLEPTALKPTALEPSALETPPAPPDPEAEIRTILDAIASGGPAGEAALTALVARTEPAATHALTTLARAPGPTGDRVLARIAAARAAQHLPAVEAALFGPIAARQRRAVAVLVEVRNMDALSLLLRASEQHEVAAVRALAKDARRELFSVEGE